MLTKLLSGTDGLVFVHGMRVLDRVDDAADFPRDAEAEEVAESLEHVSTGGARQ